MGHLRCTTCNGVFDEHGWCACTRAAVQNPLGLACQERDEWRHRAEAAERERDKAQGNHERAVDSLVKATARGGHYAAEVVSLKAEVERLKDVETAARWLRYAQEHIEGRPQKEITLATVALDAALAAYDKTKKEGKG